MSQETKLAEYLKRVTTELYDTRARLREALRPDADPVVVVGLACRYPGGVDTPGALWELLSQGKHVMTEFPADRGWESPAPGTVRVGGFLDTATGFDAGFFGIAPREATVMDPQHRILLETAWHALEDAGIDPAALRGTETGVFAGVSAGDYTTNLTELPPDLVGQISINNALGVASGRIAYLLGVHGPALSVDTACSSSLVAVHLAIQSLHRGECGLALAGGASVTATPVRFVEFSQQRALAPDGLVKPFSADADGTAWGEGAAVVVLEKLSRARERGHRVLAVLRGSGINHDGPSNGLTAPNRHAQEQLIRDTLERAGLTADSVDAVEAHGTGTTLGDPIEAQALAATYGARREGPLYLGSAKGSLGHTQAAAGITGVVSAVLALRHGLLPPIAGFSRPTPHVDWAGSGLRPLTDVTPWPETGDRPRRMAVSAFGMSGTNAHLILEEPPTPGEADLPEPDGSAAVLPLTLSAPSAAALAAQARSLREHLDSAKAAEADVAHVLARRTHHSHRAVVLTGPGDGFAALDALAGGTPLPRVVTGQAGAPGGVAFVFPGQGSEWPGMGRELLRTSRVFRETIAACDDALSEVAGWSLAAVLRGDDGAPSLRRPDVVQPALFAMMAGLAELWRSCGVRPDAVAGHSQGEIAAAWLAGALPLPDAVRVSALRGRLFTELAGRGGMASVRLSPDETRDLLSRNLEVAAVNGPLSTVVSGDLGELTALLAECERRGVRARRLPIDCAGHSAQVEAIRDRFLDGLSGLRAGAAALPCVSGVTGDWHAPADAAYWYRNLREPVRFDRVVSTLLDGGHHKLIEISPHPVLLPAIRETADAAGVSVATLGTLRRDEGDPVRWLTALAEAHVSGVALDWPAVLEGAGGRRIDLPGYAFQRDRYWLNSALPRMDGRQAGEEPSAETAADLVRRLASLAPGERDDALADLIAGHVAVVLRYSSPAAVPREDTFRDLGFESLNAVDLRNRLSAATGLELQLADVLNYPTVLDLAEYLGTRLAEAGPVAAPVAAPAGGDTLTALYLAGVREGRTAAAAELIRVAGSLRPTFATEPAAPMYRLAEGTGLALVCTTAPVAPMTDVAYGFFAAALPQPRPLWMMRPPGFAPGERLPDSRAALVRAQVRALLEHHEPDRVVLVGYSSGGWLAHELAAHLEATGTPVAALVLFDYYPYASGADELRGEFMREQVRRWPAAAEGADRALDTQLGAMGAYQGLFADWRPGELATPILHVAAADALPGRPAPAPRTRFAPPCDRVVTLPGNHLNMLSEQAEAAARAVHGWLAEVR
ncbi:acyltransferase domain-containing protein [Amycolatopsis sp. OK19-0408]|uniref:Acyltransferase domain-containing protein n=1 Tax=Amycolatopsis iheyensis TaxID=2945988 RepID=A0A9X2SI96_9PSEU|nr:type I polyketide synthase [Amycolatopsis iheyensis]MCR6483204.1 acyltransferase domain-containing protein [Amycolatopsis iheyensis]